MPEDFHWAPRCHLDKLPTGLFLGLELVASMLERVDGKWVARLHPDDAMFAPLIMRSCSSFESGRRGCEMWALRHEATLRAKAAAKTQRMRQNVARHTQLSAQPLSL
jgi:hypothetical protein